MLKSVKILFTFGLFFATQSISARETIGYESCPPILTDLEKFKPSDVDCEGLVRIDGDALRLCKNEMAAYETLLWQAVAQCKVPAPTKYSIKICKEAQQVDEHQKLKYPKLLRDFRVRLICPLQNLESGQLQNAPQSQRLGRG